MFDSIALQVKIWRKALYERLSGAMQAGGLRERVWVRYILQFSEDGWSLEVIYFERIFYEKNFLFV